MDMLENKFGLIYLQYLSLVMTTTLPTSLQTLLKRDLPTEDKFRALLPTLGEVLQCDRCFLYLRNPQTHIGKVAFCWRRKPEFLDVTDPDWKLEPDSLPQEDPLFAAALRTAPSVFVEDVETASPDVVNVEFERKYLKHRALVHAHICTGGQLWGILQPSVFDHPRVWTDFDRATIQQLAEQLTPEIVAFVKAARI